MALQAVILIPGQGSHAQQFYWSAHALKDRIYRSRAEIVKVQIAPPEGYNEKHQGLNRFQVKFVAQRGKTFALDRVDNLASLITISHAARQDGPIMGSGFQPWAAYDPFGADGNPYGGAGGDYGGSANGGSCSNETMSCTADAGPTPEKRREPFTIDMLRPEARRFWTRVGRALRADGKIIFLGCNVGQRSYIDHVANASGRTTFGPAEACSAADVETVLRLVKGIERGMTPPPMRRAQPVRR
jgi:hypothetical protein